MATVRKDQPPSLYRTPPSAFIGDIDRAVMSILGIYDALAANTDLPKNERMDLIAEKGLITCLPMITRHLDEVMESMRDASEPVEDTR